MLADRDEEGAGMEGSLGDCWQYSGSSFMNLLFIKDAEVWVIEPGNSPRAGSEWDTFTSGIPAQKYACFPLSSGWEPVRVGFCWLVGRHLPAPSLNLWHWSRAAGNGRPACTASDGVLNWFWKQCIYQVSLNNFCRYRPGQLSSEHLRPVNW